MRLHIFHIVIYRLEAPVIEIDVKMEGFQSANFISHFYAVFVEIFYMDIFRMFALKQFYTVLLFPHILLLSIVSKTKKQHNLHKRKKIFSSFLVK